MKPLGRSRRKLVVCTDNAGTARCNNFELFLAPLSMSVQVAAANNIALIYWLQFGIDGAFRCIRVQFEVSRELFHACNSISYPKK